jgi:hypothetical protein
MIATAKQRTTKLKHAGLGAWIASETLSGVACSAWLGRPNYENRKSGNIQEDASEHTIR